MQHLTEKRKADRARMVKELVAVVAECGATCEVRPEGADSISPRRSVVAIEGPRGLCCGIDFDGQSCQPDVFVNAWNMSIRTDACLTIGRFPDGDVNPFHQRKCTTVVYGFSALLDHVRNVLTRATDGELFDPVKEAEHVKENGTWQEREASFAAWREELAAKKSA
ncbi:hypothetical protein RPALISO_237 [Ruegeria phage RpAliso]|nr:hypothetical protein RPALISO_237 [Ruegeria phage RpAliso]